MRDFQCACGQTLYFENTVCNACERQLGYDPFRAELLAIEPHGGTTNPSAAQWRDVANGNVYHRCSNDTDFHVCNWLVESERHSFCLACSLNDTVPEVDSGYRASQRRKWWGRMESSKRRLIYTLLAMGLPVQGKAADEAGIAFSFLEDQRSNPHVDEEHVLTGHLEGLITVNLAEADGVNREQARQDLGESYRTLLGHFRHESGHYYFDKLINTPDALTQFRVLFGDERADYEEAVEQHYARSVNDIDIDSDKVSVYAQMHPHEDWAECWAHYLHMTDCLETAWQVGLLQDALIKPKQVPDIELCLQKWDSVSVAMNALNRSMGLPDAYPFILSETMLKKLRFVHQRIYPN